MTTIRVNEMFASIEGEGAFVGSGAVFLRLQGCPHKCPECDTKRAQDPKGGRSLRITSLAKGLTSGACRNLVITGGEPLLQGEAMGHLIEAVSEHFDRINIETSGLPQGEFCILLGRVHSGDSDPSFRGVHITWSPKSLAMLKRYRSILTEVRVGTVKLVWPLLGDVCSGPRLDLDSVLYAIEGFVQAEHYFIQPQWGHVYPKLEQGTYREIKRAVLATQWRLSTQVHRFLGLR